MVRYYPTDDRTKSPSVKRSTSPVQTRHYGRVLGSGYGLNGWQQILVLVVSVRRSLKNNCKISHRKPGPGDIKTFITTKVQKFFYLFLKDAIKKLSLKYVIQSLSLHRTISITFHGFVFESSIFVPWHCSTIYKGSLQDKMYMKLKFKLI